MTKKERKDEEFDPSIPLGAAESEEPVRKFYLCQHEQEHVSNWRN